MIFRVYSTVPLSQTQMTSIHPPFISVLHFLYCATAKVKLNGPPSGWSKWNGIKYHGEFTRINAILIAKLVGFVYESNWWYQEFLLFYTIRNALPLETEGWANKWNFHMHGSKVKDLNTHLLYCLSFSLYDGQSNQGNRVWEKTLDWNRVKTPRCVVPFFCKKI